MNILVVHGPNLNLLGESKKDPLSYGELNARITAFAAVLGVGVKVVQSNHEGTILDAIQAERKWANAILINPSALTHTSYSLRECLRLVGLPAIEVHLEDIRRRETWRRKSVIKDVCEAQVMGKGAASYLDALERLATGQYSGLAKGKSKVAAAEKAALGNPNKTVAAAAPAATPVAKTLGPPQKAVKPAGGTKTIGRAVPGELLKEAAQAPRQEGKTIGKGGGNAAPETLTRSVRTPGGITRAEVRARIAARLGNKVTAGALASWAREQWSNVDRGAATEMGHRELLDEALQALALSATPAGQLTESDLIDLMTRLD